MRMPFLRGGLTAKNYMEGKHMSTNSRIGILHNDGTTETIYCHWDGYPAHHMPILTEHYDTIEKVRALVALGDISILGERIAPDADEQHSFEMPAESVTLAYHRDRNDPPQPAVTHKSILSLIQGERGIPYFYLFDEEKGAWLPPDEG